VSSWSWWDELEQKLEQQLEAFLKSHPEQSERLRQEQPHQRTVGKGSVGGTHPKKPPIEKGGV